MQDPMEGERKALSKAISDVNDVIVCILAIVAVIAYMLVKYL